MPPPTNVGYTRLLGDSFLSFSDIQTEQLAAASAVRAYFDAPRLVLVSRTSAVDPNSQSPVVATSIDLRRETVRVLAGPGQDPEATVVFNQSRGVFETTAERDILAAFTASAGIRDASPQHDDRDGTRRVRWEFPSSSWC